MNINNTNKCYFDYQKEADVAITQTLAKHNRCLVKMFCGSGKSLLMRRCSVAKNTRLVVFVMPSLTLIRQFTDPDPQHGYLTDVPSKLQLCVSSDFAADSTTDAETIRRFMRLRVKGNQTKYICVTYQSYGTLIENLCGQVIDVCMYDEAHHVVGTVAQKLVFPDAIEGDDEQAYQFKLELGSNAFCKKQIFFTATPKNANGVVMFERTRDSFGKYGMCGPLAYEYTYLRGVQEERLNAIDIRINLTTDNSHNSVFESISRSVFETGNSRILTFHADVAETGSDTSVSNFVNESAFLRVFRRVQKEYPDNPNAYASVRMVGLSAEIPPATRTQILTEFDACADDAVYIISSCETIGEGVNTRNANCTCFVDPKTSYVKIVQNIGRIVRMPTDREIPNATVLLNCWIDKEKYADCQDDAEKCDEVLRQDMSMTGNFNGILNVLSALRQEDPELFEICLNYPKVFSLPEIKQSLAKQGFKMCEPVGNGDLDETLESVFYGDNSVEFDDDDSSVKSDGDSSVESDDNSSVESDDDSSVESDDNSSVESDGDRKYMSKMAEKHDVCIELHTNSMETPIERFNKDTKSGKIVRLFQEPLNEEETDETDENDYDEQYKYQIIVPKEKRTLDLPKTHIQAPKPKRAKVDVHTNNDVKVLWNILGENDLRRKCYTASIDCQVIRITWEERFNRVKAYIDENQKRPSKRDNNKTIKFLGSWISTQQNNYQNKLHSMTNQSHYDLWTQFITEEPYSQYFISNEDVWTQMFNQVKHYIDENQKRPSNTDKEKTVKILANWINAQQQNYKKKLQSMATNQSQYDLWTDFITEEPYAQYFVSNEEQWLKTFNQVKAYIDENIKRPSSTGKDKTVKKLARWISNQQKNYQKKQHSMTIQSQYDLWTGFITEKPYAQYFEDQWLKTFNQVKTYMDKNRKRPSGSDKYNTVKTLSNWITTQQNNYQKKQQSMAVKSQYDLWTDFITEEPYAQYFVSKEELWLKTFNQVKTYIDEYRKRPYQKQTLQRDSDKTVKILGQWIQTQQNNYRNKRHSMSNQSQYNLWTQFITEKPYSQYFVSNEDVWTQMFQQVKQYIDENQIRPSQHDKDKNVKTLANWINTQQQNYKKKQKSMANQSQYDLWTQFITEEPYAQYFQTPTIVKAKKTKSMSLSLSSKKTEIQAEETSRRAKSEISVLHQRYKTMTSENLAKEFQRDPSLWHTYHTISESNESSFPESEIPRNRIIECLNKIQTKRTKTVVDLGCGRADIARHFKDDSRFSFINYDHVSSAQNVDVCDISQIPLEDASAEIVVLCLAMWGSNCREYVKEAFRVLETRGWLYMIEPTKRWTDEDVENENKVAEPGNKLESLLQDAGFLVMEKQIQKFSMFVCVKQ